MAKRRVGLTGQKFRVKVGRATGYRIIFSIFFPHNGIDYVQFTIPHTRGDFTKIRNQAMQDLREKIQQKFNSKEYREAAVYLLLKEIFEAIKNHGDKTKLTPALTKRLVTVAFELAKREKTKTPLQQEVLLVTIPFDEYGNVELQNTQRVVLNHKDPMRIIGDTVKNAIEYSRMIYAGRYKIAGLE